MILMQDLLVVHTVRSLLRRGCSQHCHIRFSYHTFAWHIYNDTTFIPIVCLIFLVRYADMGICKAGMFKSCAIASDDEETRDQGCLQLAKTLREVVKAEQDLQAKNVAHRSGIVGKAVVSTNAVLRGEGAPLAWRALERPCSLLQLQPAFR